MLDFRKTMFWSVKGTGISTGDVVIWQPIDNDPYGDAFHFVIRLNYN